MTTKKLHAALTALLLLSSCLYAQDGELKIMTYNMLFEHNKPTQQERQWHYRVKNIVNTIKDTAPDLIGTQELQSYQVTDIMEQTGYARIGCTLKGNYSMSNDEENAAVFYRQDRLRLLASGNFWYNDHPDTPGPGLGMTYNRMCTWGKFEDLWTGKFFFVFNSHFFYEPNREEVRMSCARILKENVLKVIEDYPVFVTGDLNSTIQMPPLNYLTGDGKLMDSRRLVEKPVGPDGTYYDFKLDEIPHRRLDHILVNDMVKIDYYEVMDKQWRTGAIESDHLPVMVKARLK